MIIALRRFPGRTVFALVLLLLLFVAAYSFAVANTVPETGAGNGSGVISGYAGANVDYVLNTTNPALIDSVFLNPEPLAGAGVYDTVLQR